MVNRRLCTIHILWTYKPVKYTFYLLRRALAFRIPTAFALTSKVFELQSGLGTHEAQHTCSLGYNTISAAEPRPK